MTSAMRFRFALPASALALIALATAGLAQDGKPAKPLPVLRGAIQDASGRGLPGAQVEIIGLARVVTTGADGSYRLDDITPGKYWVVARRIGYAPLRTALTFSLGDLREVAFELEPDAQVLPEEIVTASDRRWRERFNEFVWRSRSSPGRFLTRDDLRREQRTFLDHAIGRFLFGTFDHSLGALSVGSSWGHSTLGWASSRGGGGCSGPVVSLNGNQPLGGWTLGDFRTEDVEAVEIYTFTRSLPIEFQRWNGRCGLVVIWTK